MYFTRKELTYLKDVMANATDEDERKLKCIESLKVKIDTEIIQKNARLKKNEIDEFEKEFKEETVAKIDEVLVTP